MKSFLVALTLSSFLFSSSTLACGCLLNTVIRMLAVTALPLELVSGAAAYWAKDEVTPAQEKEIYLVQAGAYASSVVALSLAMSCASDGALAPTFASMAILASAVGMASNGLEYLKNKPNSTSAHIAFTSGLAGFSAHMTSMILYVFKKYRISNPEQNGLLQV